MTPALYVPTLEPVELIFQEFERQFQLEFGFDRSMDIIPQIPFDFARESYMMMPYLLATETNFPILRYVSSPSKSALKNQELSCTLVGS